MFLQVDNHSLFIHIQHLIWLLYVRDIHGKMTATPDIKYR